jgi:hypothetical protein
VEPLAIVSLDSAPHGQPQPGDEGGSRPASTTYVWVVSLCVAALSLLVCEMLICS